jgi:hypothetical protein
MLGTFYFNNWQYFAVLAAPVFAVEIATAYFLLPLGDISPENIAEYFGGQCSFHWNTKCSWNCS